MAPFISYFGVDKTRVQNSEWLSVTQLLLEQERNNDKKHFFFVREDTITSVEIKWHYFIYFIFKTCKHAFHQNQSIQSKLAIN